MLQALMRDAKRVAEDAAIVGANNRFGSYSPRHRDFYHCPTCWIEDGIHSPLWKASNSSVLCGVCRSVIWVSSFPDH